MLIRSYPYLYPYPHIAAAESKNPEWISGDDGLTMTWSGSNSGAFTLLQTTLQNPGPFQEIAGTCQDGTAYYAMLNVRGVPISS